MHSGKSIYVQKASQEYQQIIIDCEANYIKFNQFYVENGFEYIGESDGQCIHKNPFIGSDDERIF
ncbi:hypothetical protein ABID52_001976 [Fictibacillus halophilus]|uniref:Uncharacterized protein n=1 Tax=Fictibacillus halophilus TaxID=1610490 RepID=A0ABV2LIH8_9BACL